MSAKRLGKKREALKNDGISRKLMQIKIDIRAIYARNIFYMISNLLILNKALNIKLFF